ncbi:hypothetical protein M408DRAFT_36739, partial [Serendipita vermifera MAFF 305830]
LQVRFQRLEALTDLDDIISTLRKFAELTPDGHEEKAIRLMTVGNALKARFNRFQRVSDIDETLSCQRKAVELTPDDRPVMPLLLANLGATLQNRFKFLNNLADIDDAIYTLRKGMEMTSNAHPAKSALLTHLGAAQLARFDHVGSRSDIDDAILSFRQSMEVTPDGDPHRPERLRNLGSVLITRFGRFGNVSDIEDALSIQRKAGSISNLRQAVELTQDAHPDTPLRLGDLGSAYLARFDHLGNQPDIEEAILCQRKAIQLVPDGHPSVPVHLGNLGGALLTRFKAQGSVADIEETITTLFKAIKLMPDGNPHKPPLLLNLGSALKSRFQRLKSRADIQDAISCLQKAVELTPDGHKDKSSRLNDLGSALRIRFMSFDNQVDIEDAILNLRKAVELTPDEHRDKPSRLNNLANALRSYFELHKVSKDIDDAITNLRKAVALTADGHPDKPSLLTNLGSVLLCCSETSCILSEIEDAISVLRKAAELMPDGHPMKPIVFFNLGNALHSRFKSLACFADVEDALSATSRAATSQTGSPRVRFDASISWVRILEEHFPSTSPLPAFRCAIDLLPQIAWAGLSIVDQHSLLAQAGDIAREAVAAAIRMNECETAVEWAEQGRSIAWQNLLGLRTPIEDLRIKNSNLADLDPSERTLNISLIDIAQKYSLLAIERETIIDEIRRIPGFQAFMRAKTFAELAPAASEGAVVILNDYQTRCDALILNSDGSKGGSVSVSSIPLKDLTSTLSIELQRNLKSLLRSAGVRARGPRKSEKDYSDELPRIWWSTTGSLSFLPIHAAGMYGMEGLESCVSDYVVSSYAPTLTAILDQTQCGTSTDFQILTISQPATPYARPIPMTETEVKLIKQYTKDLNVVNLSSEHATVKSVLEGMKTSNWIHLACHGEQNVKEPMKSGFLLHDQILELSMIVRTTLPATEFAFLSACQTAVGDEKIADESVHLAAGMLLAGCRGVIATMWSIEDEDAPTVTEEVYSRILKDGVPNRKAAARALQEGVERLKRSGASFLKWVPYIHIG